jgi:uncharacterized protein YbjQ (UPF0145 family)
MIISTSNNLEGHSIVACKGVFTGEAIRGANVVRDFFAAIRDIVDGRSGACETELRKAREYAFEWMREQARDLGADAIVGVDIDDEPLGENGGRLMVKAAGTVVKRG